VHNLQAVQVIINFYAGRKIYYLATRIHCRFSPDYLSTLFSCCAFIQVCFLQKRHLSCSYEKFVRF